MNPVVSRRTVLKAAGVASVAAALPRPTVAFAATPSAGVTDHVLLGDPQSERAHELDAVGATKAQAGSVEQGQLTEGYTARGVTTGGRFTVRLRVAPGQPLTLQLREVRPNNAWGVAYGYRVFLGGTMVHVRDPQSADPGGGVYTSVFIDSNDPSVTSGGVVELSVEGASANAAYLQEVWAYGDLPGMVRAQAMRVPDRMVFVLGQDYRGEQFFRQRLDYVAANIRSSPGVGLGLAVLDYYAVRTSQQEAANYQLWLRLSRDYGMPFAAHSTSDWEGTPGNVPDGKGGHFGDIKYQQILWSPQDQTGPDEDVWNGQRLDDLLGDRYEPHYGLSVPNIWGNTPWLTWRNPDLNAYYAGKLNDSIDALRPMVWDLQRTNEPGLILPFSTTTESTYWSKRAGEGVADQAYTSYNGGVERRDLDSDFNPSVVAAAEAEGVILDPVNGLSDAAKHWLYKNQSYQQQMFADIFYDNLPRERITAGADGVVFPTDMLRHNVHSEIYSRKQEPYWSGVYPSQAEGVLRHARPGSEYIELNDYSPGGFYHLQRSREFGRLANPNLENSVSFYPPDKILLLRQTYINGSRYTEIYNWQAADANPPADRVENWVNPFINDMHPWDAANDGPPDGRITGQTTVGTAYTAGDVRLADQVDIRVQRTGPPAPLRLTIYSSPAKEQVVAMRYLSASEVPSDGWASFYFAVTELAKGNTYYLEIAQPSGSPGYAFPTTGGTIGYRVGLDMLYERDRSLLINWRRDAADAIAHVAGDTTAKDTHAVAVLNQARSALARDEYVTAYRLAMKADSLRYPVLYQATGTATLTPFPLTSATNGTINVDVRSYTAGQDMTFDVQGYTSGQVTFTVSSFSGTPRVTFDGQSVPVTSKGQFTITLPDVDSHQVIVAGP